MPPTFENEPTQKENKRRQTLKEKANKNKGQLLKALTNLKLSQNIRKNDMWSRNTRNMFLEIDIRPQVPHYKRA